MDSLNDSPPNGVEEHHSEEPPTKRVRRNGLASSCEPCRKSKLACDHEHPCARCVRGKKACYYHPAPMTRENGAISPSSSTATDSKVAIKANDVPSPPKKVSATTCSGHSLAGQKLACLSNPLTLASGGRLGYGRKPSRYVPGYLGSTAHSAVLLNNKGLVGDDVSNEMPLASEHALKWCDNAQKKFGVSILAWLPCRRVCEEALARYFRVTLAVTSCQPMYTLYFNRFWDRYGSYLDEPKTEYNLGIISSELCKNTIRNAHSGLAVPKTSEEFIDSFTGSNSRWDMLGSIFVAMGFVCVCIPETDPFLDDLLPPNTTPKDFAASMLEVADSCLLLCDELDVQSNLLTLLLLYKCVCFQSVIGGDTSYSLWKRLGSLTAAVTAFGLHRQNQLQAPYSLLYVELQKRIFSSVFGMSCVLATFHGRPPGLSRHYLSGELPLDGSEEDLMSDNEALIRSNLCEDGWNRDGKIYPATMGRAFLISHLIREEILEICLGHNPPHVIEARIQHVRDRIDKEWSCFPSKLKEPLTKEVLGKKDAWDIACMSQVQLSWTHHSFLLEQFDHPGRNEERHLEIARQMLGMVNLLWSERDRFLEHKDDIHWFLSSYGIPSASTIAVDLYHQVHSAELRSPSPHRSKTIQDLSLFVAALEWVSPSDGNFALCQRVSKLLRHILDRVLAPPSVPGYSPQDFAGFDLNDLSVANLPAFGAEVEEFFSVDWSSAPKMVFG